MFVSFTKTYLVTGGDGLASTELLHQDASQWVYAGALPSARYGLKGATLGDKLIMTGEMMMMMMMIVMVMMLMMMMCPLGGWARLRTGWPLSWRGC